MCVRLPLPQCPVTITWMVTPTHTCDGRGGGLYKIKKSLAGVTAEVNLEVIPGSPKGSILGNSMVTTGVILGSLKGSFWHHTCGLCRGHSIITEGSL